MKVFLFKLVAGVHIERVWKFESKLRKTSSADVIATLSKKKVFSRNFMETTMGLTTGQAYWYIQHFLRSGMIKKLKVTEYVGNKGKKKKVL